MVWLKAVARRLRVDSWPRRGFQTRQSHRANSSGDRLSHRAPASPTPARAPAAMEEEVGPGADMEALVRRLRLHRPGPSPYEPSAAVAPAPGSGELFRPRRAAVLVCLFRGNSGELRVILTKRSSSLSVHSGEVALPGGKAEEGDADDAATALRESKEEIGLDPALVTIVTSLEHCLSKHLLVVVPIVGVLSDINAFKPVLNAAEVDKIFDVPLEMFLKDENRTSTDLEWMGQEFTVHHFSYAEGNEKYMIWGLTAAILINAASVVYQRPPDFAEKWPQINLPKTVSNRLCITLPIPKCLVCRRKTSSNM